ncbi:MAG: Mur ligase family protein, partial [Bacteroidales bacterium]|nr:Mur ligase family protein [Bacteroidales bacterium]
MSAIARYYKHAGCNVSGYDRTPSDITKALDSEGIAVHYEDEPSMIPTDKENTLVIYTPAIPPDMKELVKVNEEGYEIVKRSRALGHISANQECLAVSGSHGKTSTSTLIAHIYTSSGIGCSAFLGGISKNYNTNLLLSKNPVLVAEADEFDRSFLQLFPHIAVVTATDPDHLDIYGNVENMRAAFAQFASQIDAGGYLVMKRGIKLDLTNVKA